MPRQVLRRVAARTRNSNFAEMVFVGPASELCVDSGGLDLADALFHDAIMLRRCAFRIRAGICCGTMPRDRMCPGGVCAVPVDTVPGVVRGPRWSRARGGAESATPRHDAPPRRAVSSDRTPAGRGATNSIPFHLSTRVRILFFIPAVRRMPPAWCLVVA